MARMLIPQSDFNFKILLLSPEWQYHWCHALPSRFLQGMKRPQPLRFNYILIVGLLVLWLMEVISVATIHANDKIGFLIPVKTTMVA